MIPDRDPTHLYPEFRKRLLLVHKELRQLTGLAWGIIEGYRSERRQLWIYAQGRTRPGAIVTWMRHPRFHGAGLAADSAPAKKGEQGKNAVWYGAPREVWEQLRIVGKKHGLINPAWHKGDLGHLQIGDSGMVAVAGAWTRAGFPARDRATPPREIAIIVKNRLVPDADGSLIQSNTGPKLFVWTRAVLDAAGYVILYTTPIEIRVAPGRGAGHEVFALSVSRSAGRAMVSAKQLAQVLGWGAEWEHEAKRLTFTVPPQKGVTP